MRHSRYFFRTLKQAPQDAEIRSHQLLERSGMIFKISKGVFSYTPLFKRVIDKLCHLIRSELEKEGALEAQLPQLHSKEVWDLSGRWEAYKAEKLLYHFEDREDHPFCIAPTCEEVCTLLAANWINSYKQLPVNLYQITNKFRDEIRPRFGLMRAKEFLMKDGYSFDATEEGMHQSYAAMKRAYTSIFERLGLKFAAVEAHGGKIAGKSKSEEFQVLAQVGEDAILCVQDRSMNVETAKAIPPSVEYSTELEEAEKKDTPGTTTIEQLSEQLRIPAHHILKCIVYTLIYSDRKECVLIGIRGDRQINPIKVCDFFNALEVQLAQESDVVKHTGVQKGFIGPIGSSLPFYADESCRPMTNFCAACNEKDRHMIHLNWKRDLPEPPFEDFLLAEAGDQAPEGGTYEEKRGIEVGHIFTMGKKYSQQLSAQFQNEQGKPSPFWMGTYGIGVGRLAQACVEQLSDEKGIIWPSIIAPFQITITAANDKDPLCVEQAEKLYEQLRSFDPILDDRKQRLGFKLKDSDLIGIPYKLIVGKGFSENQEVEIESRAGEKITLKCEQLDAWANEKLRCQ